MSPTERLGHVPRRPDAATHYLALLRYAKWTLLLIIVAYLFLSSLPNARRVQLLVDDANSAQVLNKHHTHSAPPSYTDLWDEGGSAGKDADAVVATPRSDDAIHRVMDIRAARSHVRPAPPERDDDELMQINIVDDEDDPSDDSPAAPAPRPRVNARLDRPNLPVQNENVQLQSSLESHLPPPIPHDITTDIDIISLTVSDDFFVLFNNSALASWIKYIQNVKSITFIGRPQDSALFHANMHQHYTPLVAEYGEKWPRIRWVNETYFTSMRKRYRCPYPSVCQQMIKLHVFDLRTKLGMDYIGDNVLIVDSDTVWSRDTTFVYPDGRVQYWDARGTTKEGARCDGMDPVEFTEAITAGPLQFTAGSTAGDPIKRKDTLTPYKACRRKEYRKATGGRHIVHHMLFQFDVMMHLHGIITSRWKTKTLWQAFNTCYTQKFCQGRIAEYELYFAFVSEQYPRRVKLDTLTNGVDYMGSSAICTQKEMDCCEKKRVLLKGCHDHRIKWWREGMDNPGTVGDLCCPEDLLDYVDLKVKKGRARPSNRLQ